MVFVCLGIFLLKILGQLNLIDASENSEVKMFLQKSLKKDPNSRNEMNGSSDDTDSVKVIMSIGIVEWGNKEFYNLQFFISNGTWNENKV